MENSKAQDIIQTRIQRWLKMYDRSQPPSSLFLLHYESEWPVRPLPTPENYSARLEWAWQKYQLQLEQLTWLDDDSIPYLDMLTGTEIFAAAFGCRVHYPSDNNPFAMPLVQSAEEAAKLTTPSLDSPHIAPLFKMAEELQRRAGPQALFRLVDIQSPMDIAALIWEKTSFYPALIETPEVVQELAFKVRTFLFSFLDEWFARFGRSFIAHYPEYYVPSGITLSEDEVGAVSGRAFNRFFLPELVEISNRYGSLGMHCCANSRHQWENFKKIPNLRLLNLNQPREVLDEALVVFETIVPQMHVCMNTSEPWLLPGQQPPQARIVYDYPIPTREKTLEALALFKQALGHE
jgi:hypothetical protein